MNTCIYKCCGSPMTDHHIIFDIILNSIRMQHGQSSFSSTSNLMRFDFDITGGISIPGDITCFVRADKIDSMQQYTKGFTHSIHRDDFIYMLQQNIITVYCIILKENLNDVDISNLMSDIGVSDQRIFEFSENVHEEMREEFNWNSIDKVREYCNVV